MGANFVTKEYPVHYTRKAVEAAFNEAVEQSRYEDGHCYSGEIGMVTGLLFENHTLFGNEEGAIEWLQDHAQKWGEAKCVRLVDGRWIIGAWCAS